MEENGGLKLMHRDIIVSKQKQHGTKGETTMKIEVGMKQLDPMSTFHYNGWMHVLGTSWLNCLVGHIVWLPYMF